MEALTIAVAQFASACGEVERNVKHHVEFVERAGSHGADLIVFPELSLTGYEPQLADDLAFSILDARLSPLRAVATATGSTVLAGAPVRAGSKLHIGAFVITPREGVQLYTKLHVTEDESKVFVPGDENPLVDVGGEAGAVAICADTTFQAHAEKAAERGAHFYLAGVFFGPENLEANRGQLSGYASRYSMVVAMANSGGSVLTVPDRWAFFDLGPKWGMRGPR